MNGASENPVPQIVQLNYQDGVVTLGWVMQGITPSTPFKVSITNEQTHQTTSYPATGFFAHIAADLTDGVPYTAVVAQDLGGGQFGPPSPPVPIITVSPVVTLVQNTGNGLRLNWNVVTGYTRYSAVLQQIGQQSQSQSVVGTTCFFDGALTGTGYTTGVAAQSNDSVSTGPIAKVYTPIVDAPIVSTVQNTGAGLLLVWQLVGTYLKYQATLQETGQQPVTQVATGNSYTFNGALTGPAYTTYVAAQSDDGVLIGPPSLSYQPILTAPVMTGVENTGAGLKLSWNALPPYTRYVAVLQQIGSQSRSESVPTLTWTFAGTLSGTGFSTDVAAQSNDKILIGPPSTVYVPIVNQPSWTEIDYITGSIDASWTQVSDAAVSGYLIQITDSGGQSSSYPVPNTNTATLPVTLQPSRYSMVVRATNGIVLGPWSATLVPLTKPPQAMTLGFDGTHLIGNWQPASPPDPQVTGYVVQLLANGIVSETLLPPQPPQTFVSGLTTATIYTAQTRATGDRVKGPWSAPATGPYAAAWTITFDASGRLQRVAWTGAMTQTYTYDTAGNITSVAYAPTPPASS